MYFQEVKKVLWIVLVFNLFVAIARSFWETFRRRQYFGRRHPFRLRQHHKYSRIDRHQDRGKTADKTTLTAIENTKRSPQLLFRFC